MSNKHPHSMADMFEALNPGEARISHVCPPVPSRQHDWQASLYDGEPSIGEGRTREEAALDALQCLGDDMIEDKITWCVEETVRYYIDAESAEAAEQCYLSLLDPVRSDEVEDYEVTEREVFEA